MQYVEFSTSVGPGTLIEHGVSESNPSIEFWLGNANYREMELITGWNRHGAARITPHRYFEFIAIHGGERAV